MAAVAITAPMEPCSSAPGQHTNGTNADELAVSARLLGAAVAHWFVSGQRDHHILWRREGDGDVFFYA